MDRSSGFRPEIMRALAFIGSHLDGPLTVAEVAAAAHLSPFHFHRVFHAIVGEPVGRFITRRRLEVAALRLAYEPHRSITHIALSSGYSSPSNFTKAFMAHFGCSPSSVRDPARGLPSTVGRLTERYGKGFDPAALYALPPNDLSFATRREEARRWDETVRFVDRPAMAFACLASPNGYALDALEGVWADMVRWAQQLGLAGAGGAVDAWGAAHDSPQLTAASWCRYHACVPCPPNVQLPAPLFRGEMPEGRYAVFAYDGAVADVEAAYRSIYSCWFPTSALEPDDYVPLDHYVHDAPRDGRVEMEMWLKVRPTTRS